jgi:hypothetical protein
MYIVCKHQINLHAFLPVSKSHANKLYIFRRLQSYHASPSIQYSQGHGVKNHCGKLKYHWHTNVSFALFNLQFTCLLSNYEVCLIDAQCTMYKGL